MGYPLVNQHKYGHVPFLLGKLTINGHVQLTNSLSSGYEGAIYGAFGVSIFPIYFLLNGEPRRYLEFPKHLIVAGDLQSGPSLTIAKWVYNSNFIMVYGNYN